MSGLRHGLLALALALSCTVGPVTASASAESAADLNAQGKAALSSLYAQSTKAARFGKDAVAILVFPKIVKAGLLVGGQGGEGVLLVHGKATAYYKIGAVSYGLQAGGQTYSYALFFMNKKSLDYLSKSDGWAIGSGPSVVVMDKGKAMSNTSTTITEDVYAFPFGQKGLMAGLGLEGSKITPVKK